MLHGPSARTSRWCVPLPVGDVTPEPSSSTSITVHRDGAEMSATQRVPPVVSSGEYADRVIQVTRPAQICCNNAVGVSTCSGRR